ncbi:MAG: hypothetical protein SXQ77_04750, partial [Halobacteria archaeon]|nr:hypothetical protein [Halobacteria archaeon]
LKSEWKQYGVYLIVEFIAGLSVNLVVGLLMLLVGIVLLIPFLIIAFILLAIFPSSGFVPATALGFVVLGVVALIFFLIFIAISLLAQVPVITYFKYYALFVLGDTNEEFDLIPDIREEVRADGGDGDGDGDGDGESDEGEDGEGDNGEDTENEE